MMEGSACEKEFENVIMSDKKSFCQEGLITNVVKDSEGLEAVKGTLNASTMDLRPNILQPSVKLKQLKIILTKKFDCLSIHQAISRYGVPFLHIWKPISKVIFISDSHLII